MGKTTTVSKQAVIDAACRLFAERGYHGTSVRDIADAVGVRAPSLYNHMSSKQDVLVTIMDIAMNRALTALDDALRDIDDPPSMLRAAAESLVLDFLNNPYEVTVCNNEIRSLDEPRRSLIVAKRDKYARRVRAIIDRGCAAGHFTTGSPRLAAYAVLEMGNGVKTWFSPSGEFSKAQVAREYGEFALRIAGVRADRSASLVNRSVATAD